MESISPSVKHLPDFDPCAGVSYKKYGKLTDESAKKAYFTLMEKNAERLKKDSKVVPSLKRVAAFFAKVVEAKDTKYQAPSRAPTVFCLGDFLKIETNEAADSAMEIVEINGSSQEISEGSQMNVEGSTTQPANEN
jgi:hypothetical protein